MKRLSQFYLVASICAVFAVLPCWAQPDTLTIIHVNDTHSNLMSYGNDKYGGMARAASIIGLWQLTEPNPITVHGGDFMVGTLFFNAYFGVPELQLLQAMGFDVLQLGNHEFDPGPGDLGNVLYAADLDSSFNVISSNAVIPDSVQPLKSIVRALAIEQRGNVKVGFFGLTTPAANIESNPYPVFIDTNLVPCAVSSITTLKEGYNCQVVVMVSHLGLTNDMQLAGSGYLAGVDLIVSAHSHDTTPIPVYINDIPIIQAGSYYHYVGKATLVFNGSSTQLVDYTLQEIDDQIPAESFVNATVEGLKAGIQAEYTPVIGDPFQEIFNAAEPMPGYPDIPYPSVNEQDTLDTPIGNLITTALLYHVPDAELAIEACGHIVEGLYPGPVSSYDLFRTYSYGFDARDGLGFRVVTFNLYGAELLGIMDALADICVPSINYWDYLLQCSGLSYAIKIASPEDTVQLLNIAIQGNPVVPEQLYKIASSDQVAGYLINLFQITPQNLQIDSVSVFKTVLDYLNYPNDVPRAEISYTFELGNNYPNPFNPATVIPFTLTFGNKVKLTVFDALGREVCTLVSSWLPAGKHVYTWNGRNAAGNLAASGIYFYRLTMDMQQVTHKMLLLR